MTITMSVVFNTMTMIMTMTMSVVFDTMTMTMSVVFNTMTDYDNDYDYECSV